MGFNLLWRSILENYFDEALQLASSARREVYPNPRVGALVIKDERVLACGFHRKSGGAHAEVEALSACGEEAVGATLLVTLEPCSHHGRTPPCTDLILKRGIAKVVYGLNDPNTQVAGGRILRERGIDVEGPVYHPGLLSLIEPFAKILRLKRTYLTLKWAMTADGSVATESGDSRWVSCEESLRRVHELRSRVDGIMVGAGTMLADQPDLGIRYGIDYPPPRPVVFDPAGRSSAMNEWWEERRSRRPLLVQLGKETGSFP
ncbi:MAG: bifunctional diaminohydroxyphosphoribosylaminopyrimidine deaminase/5-amino-6-(5-phosphoribosylamino)uracil reductase RibD, partial [Planctomycetes bacterium]|nr:bifunctional diaminohydroxyphosphoribosylaminopyrimidine deaminase/5-amino-6-(5-phosphoribosylamino)uracil reductase RibD [Planctomycetota bacterium]